MKKYLSTISLLILMTFTNVPVVNADLDDTGKDGVDLIECIRKGKYDFIAFINASVSNENFVELFTETWKDLFFRNACHALTVLGLLEQRNSVRAAIRDASLSCGGAKPSLESDCGDGEDNDGDGKIDKDDAECLDDGELDEDYNEEVGEIPNQLEERYKEINAEIYYVRNIVDGKLTLSLPFNLLSTRLFTKPAIKNRDKLYTEMKEKYVSKDFFDQEEFDILFLDIESKYGKGLYTGEDCGDGEDNDGDGDIDDADTSCNEERLDKQGKPTGETKYNPKLQESDCNFTDKDARNDIKCNFISCKSGSWQQVAEKVKEFEEGWEAIKEAWGEVEDQAAQLADDARELGNRFSSAKNFFGPLFEFKLNNQKFADGFSQMAKDLADDFDFSQYGSESLSSTTSFLQGAILGDEVADRGALGEKMVAKFYTRYTSNFNGFQDVINLLDKNIEIINTSIDKLKEIETKSANLKSKQCKKTS